MRYEWGYLFWATVSVCSPDWCEILHVDQTVCKLTEIWLSLPSDIKVWQAHLSWVWDFAWLASSWARLSISIWFNGHRTYSFTGHVPNCPCIGHSPGILKLGLGSLMYQISSSFWSRWPLAILASKPGQPVEPCPSHYSSVRNWFLSPRLSSPRSQRNILTHFYYSGLEGKT